MITLITGSAQAAPVNVTATVIVSVILAVLATIVIYILIRDKRKGRTSCGYGCEACEWRETCHKKEKDKPASH